MIAWSPDDRTTTDLGRVLEQVLPFHPHVRDIACAVESAFTGESGCSVPATDRALWNAARALAAVGDRGAASAVLGVTSAWAGWSEALDLTGLPEPTLRLLESGLVRASTSSVLGSGLLVALDLRLLSTDAAGLELVYLPLAHRLVDACLPLWDRSNGRGSLVVYGLLRHEGAVSGARRTGRRNRWLTRILQDRLCDQAAGRDWSESPRLVQAD